MAQEVEMPDGTVLEFPDGMSDDEMKSLAGKYWAQNGPRDTLMSDPATAGGMSQLSQMSRNPEVRSADTGRPGGVANLENRAKPKELTFGQKVALGVNAFGNGVLLGYGDEANALADSLVGRGSYEDQLSGIRAGQDKFREESPVAAYGAEIVGGMMLPGAALKSGAGAVANTGRAAAAGAGYGAVYASGESEGGLSDRALSAVGGAAAGAVGGALSVPIGKAVSWAAGKIGPAAARVFRQRRYFDGAQLTDEGRAAIEKIGLDPEVVNQRFAEAFSRRAAAVSEPAQGARAALLDEFNVPAYRPNVTGEVGDFAEFEAARRGAMGDDAAQRVREAADRQMGAVRSANERLATDISGGQPFDQFDAAVSARDGLVQARDQALGAARSAYDDLAAAGGGAQGENAVGLGSRIANDLRMNNIRIDSTRTPNAAASIQDIDDVFADAARGTVPFMDIERARQQLVRQRGAADRGSLGADQNAMRAVIESFDQKVDDLLTTAMTEGDSAVLDQARKARGLWREYSQTFTGDGASSRFIQKMIDEDASPDDIAKWMFSAGKMGTGRFNSTLASGLRETLGADSEAWSAIRQGAFRQLVMKPEGTTQPGPQKMATNIREFFNSPTTRQLSRELFSADERRQMLRYSSALKQLVPPDGAVNYSNTGYENARTASRALQAIAGMLGMASGGPGGAVVAAGATSAAQGAATRGAVTRAINPASGPDVDLYSAAIAIPAAEAGMRGAEWLGVNPSVLIGDQ